MFIMLIHVSGINGLLYYGGGGRGAMSNKIIPFLVDDIVKMIILTLKSKNCPTFGHIFARY